jgi:hypothetical protein
MCIYWFLMFQLVSFKCFTEFKFQCGNLCVLDYCSYHDPTWRRSYLMLISQNQFDCRLTYLMRIVLCTYLNLGICLKWYQAGKHDTMIKLTSLINSKAYQHQCHFPYVLSLDIMYSYDRSGLGHQCQWLCWWQRVCQQGKGMMSDMCPCLKKTWRHCVDISNINRKSAGF